jgi:SAM-dependent methyltransferase
MHVFEQLVAERKLLCPETKLPAEIRAGRVVAPSGRDFGPVTGPLDLLVGAGAPLDASTVPASDVARLRTELQLPATVAVDAQVASAIAATGKRHAAAHLSAEVRTLAQRFRIADFAVAAPEPQAAPHAAPRSIVDRWLKPRAQEAFRLEFISHSIGERLTAGQQVYRSVRVRNASLAALPAARATIRTRWDGLLGDDCACASELPIDLEPGREITLVTLLRAPANPGTRSVRVELLVDGAPSGPPFLETRVEVIPCELPVFEYEYSPVAVEYVADHHYALLEVSAFLGERYPGRRAAILEIGGGVHPTGHALAAQGHHVVSCDISHAQSILGTLYFGEKMPELKQRLGFVSCDGVDLPFADGSFDGVMLIAAFHHFADPVKLLREARRVTAPDGFVFLGCDSCVPEPHDGEYRGELARGINEQLWTLAEFDAFFRAAGLRPARARVDLKSLKVALVKR